MKKIFKSLPILALIFSAQLTEAHFFDSVIDKLFEYKATASIAAAAGAFVLIKKTVTRQDDPQETQLKRAIQEKKEERENARLIKNREEKRSKHLFSERLMLGQMKSKYEVERDDASVQRILRSIEQIESQKRDNARLLGLSKEQEQRAIEEISAAEKALEKYKNRL